MEQRENFIVLKFSPWGVNAGLSLSFHWFINLAYIYCPHFCFLKTCWFQASCYWATFSGSFENSDFKRALFSEHAPVTKSQSRHSANVRWFWIWQRNIQEATWKIRKICFLLLPTVVLKGSQRSGKSSQQECGIKKKKANCITTKKAINMPIWTVTSVSNI